ncbi:MAG: hypothetical protein V8R82_11160 [Clostridia bacterium]
MEAKIFEILTYFIIYSFLGWIMESIVSTVSDKDNKYLIFEVSLSNLSGIGAIIMLLFLERYQNKPILIIFYSHYCTNYMGVLSGSFIRKNISYKILGLFEQKFNFQGRICLVNSICWGILGVIFVKYFIHL